MPPLLQVIGRFHPLVLHLPIGLLTGVAILEMLSFASRGPGLRTAQRALVIVSALAAAFTAGSGYVLSLEGGYDAETLNLHLWLGIALGALAVLGAIAHERACRVGPEGPTHSVGARSLRPFRALLVLALLVMVPAGHLGATLTHGENFLLAPLSGASKPAPQGSTRGSAQKPQGPFEMQVRPILDASCTACHGPTKQKANLAVHTVDALLLGGDSGPAIVPGESGASELIIRMRLPISDDDHMPPKNKRQPSKEQIDTIAAWIDSLPSTDASTPHKSSAKPAPKSPEASPAPAPASTPEPIQAHAEPKPVAPSAPPDAAIDALRRALVHVQPVEAGSSGLWIDFAASAGTGTLDDARLASLLTPLAPWVEDLSLARTGAGEATLHAVGAMPRLAKLNLSRTRVADASLAPLAGLKHLTSLNIAGTEITDAGLRAALAGGSVRQVFAWGSRVTVEQAVELTKSSPGLAIDLGQAAEAPALEVEPPPTLTKSAPAPEAPRPQPATLDAANTACPVTGSPVNAKYRIVYEGRVIAFCCPDCPKKFWENPAAYAAKLGP